MDKPGPTNEQYWKWGRPSLILAVVALFFTIYSQFNQSRIADYYRGIVADGLEHRTGNISSEIKRLKRAELAAKRLVQMDANAADSNVAESRLNAARLAIDSSIAHQQLANELHRQGSIAASNVEIEAGRMAMQRATDAMRRAAKLSGKPALEAQLWLISQSIPTTPLATTGWDPFWNDVIRQIQQEAVTPSSGNNTPSDDSQVLALVLERLRIESLASLSRTLGVSLSSPLKNDRTSSGAAQAARFLPQTQDIPDGSRRAASIFQWDSSTEVPKQEVPQSIEERRHSMERLLTSLDRSGVDDPRLFACHLEAMECLDPDRAVTIARARFKDLIEARDASGSDVPSPRELDRIDSVFVAMLVLGSTDEAIAFALSNLESVRRTDQAALHGILTQSLVRGVGRSLWFPSADEEIASKRISGFVKGLFLVGIKYPLVCDLIDRILWPRQDDEVALRLNRAMDHEHELGMQAAFGWLRNQWAPRDRAGTEDPNHGANAIPIDRIDDELARPMLGFIAYLLREKRNDAETSYHAISQMVENWPTIGELRIAESMLAMETGRHAHAIATLNDLNEKIPDNPQIQELLLKAYERALKSK